MYKKLPIFNCWLRYAIMQVVKSLNKLEFFVAVFPKNYTLRCDPQFHNIIEAR